MHPCECVHLCTPAVMKNDLGSYYDKNGSAERYPRCYYHKVAIKIYWHVWVCRLICMPSHDRPSSVLNVYEISGRRRLTVNPSNFPYVHLFFVSLQSTYHFHTFRYMYSHNLIIIFYYIFFFQYICLYINDIDYYVLLPNIIHIKKKINIY